jgi:hypothetical protein
VLRDIERVESQAQKDGIAVHEALARRLSKKTPLPAEYNLLNPLVAGFDILGDLQTELKLGVRVDRSPCDFFAKDVWGRGALDVVMMRSDNTAMLIDWKNGKVREDPFELKVQACLLKAKYPQLEKITGFYVWLKVLEIGEQYDLSDTDAHWSAIIDRIIDIVRYQQLDNWPKIAGPLCGWCPVSACEHWKR